MSTGLEVEQKPRRHSESSVPFSTSENDADIPASALVWGAGVLLVYFAARLLFFALNIAASVPPDEVTHAGVCKVFARTFLLPANSPDTYQFGLVTNIAWLYYWLMGKMLHLNVTGLPDLAFLRLLNIPFAFGTIWYAVRLLRILADSRLAQLLLIAVLTNIPMFTFLSASVSYDNMANMLAAMAIFYQFAFIRERSAGLLAASLVCQLLGCLTKVTFLPLMLSLNLVLAAYEWRRLGGVAAAVREYFRLSARRAVLAFVMLLILCGLNIHLYGGNYLRYGSLFPGLAEVVSPRAAMQYRLGARGMIFTQYREGKISYLDALVLAGEINHPIDKADTFYLLMNYEKLKQNPQLWLSPSAYVKFWFQNMLGTTFGIKAHLGMFKPPGYLLPFYLVAALAMLGLILRWRRHSGGDRIAPGLAAIAILYAGYLLYAVNYDNYRAYGEPGLTMYGRYLFLLLAPVAVLLCRYLTELFRSRQARLVLTLATVLLFVSYDFPWFLVHATPEWYEWLPR